MQPWAKTTTAIVAYERFMVEHNKRFETTSNAMDAKHWFQIRDEQIREVQQAFHKESGEPFSLCLDYSLKQIQEKVGYGIS
jgi:hypothetical protein